MQSAIIDLVFSCEVFVILLLGTVTVVGSVLKIIIVMLLMYIVSD